MKSTPIRSYNKSHLAELLGPAETQYQVVNCGESITQIESKTTYIIEMGKNSGLFDFAFGGFGCCGSEGKVQMYKDGSRDPFYESPCYSEYGWAAVQEVVTTIDLPDSPSTQFTLVITPDCQSEFPVPDNNSLRFTVYCDRIQTRPGY